jgi:ribosome recycling factor
MTAHFPDLEDKCKKTVEHFKKDLSHMRTGRASAALFEGIHVDYYGSSVPLQQLGLVNTPEPRLVTIQVYDPGAVEAVEKSILQSDLGLNPSRDGNLLRIAIPHLTEERRKDLIKKSHKMAEETRIAIRNNRRDAIEHLKKREKSKEVSEDELHRGQEEIQKITDKYTKDVDLIVAAKEKEMMEV